MHLVLKSPLSKIRVAYNNLYCKISHVSRRSSASEMSVQNNITNFETLYRKETSSFIGYEPAGLTVHPPPRMIESGFIFFVWVSSATKFFPQKKSGFCRRY